MLSFPAARSTLPSNVTSRVVRVAFVAVALILFGHTVVRHAAMRRRLAEWDHEWARTEPAWTGRRA